MSKQVVVNQSESYLSQSLVQKEPKYIGYRWFILFLFCMDEIAVSILFMSCGPISVILGEIYNQDALIVAATITGQMLMFPICTIPATYTIDKYGLATSIKVGSLLVMVGVSMRCLVYFESQFYWVLIGSFIQGFGRPFIINAQGDMIQVWFPPTSRTKLITLTNMLVTVSLISGTVIAASFFAGYVLDMSIESNIVEGKQRFIRLLFCEAVFTIFFLLLTLMFFRSKKHHIEKENMKFSQQFMSVCKNGSFIIIFLTYSLCFGNLKAYGVLSPYMLHVYGFNSSDNALISMGPIIGGLLSTSFVAHLYKKVGSYKVIIVVAQIFCIINFILNYLSLYFEVLWMLMITSIGFFIMPQVPLLIEWGCKAIRPISDSFSIGLLYSGATLSGALLGEIDIKILKGNKADGQSVLITTGVIVGCFVFSTILCIINPEEKQSKVHKTPSNFSNVAFRAYTISNSIDVQNVFHTDNVDDDPLVVNFLSVLDDNTDITDSGEKENNNNNFVTLKNDQQN